MSPIFEEEPFDCFAEIAVVKTEAVRAQTAELPAGYQS